MWETPLHERWYVLQKATYVDAGNDLFLCVCNIITVIYFLQHTCRLLATKPPQTLNLVDLVFSITLARIVI